MMGLGWVLVFWFRFHFLHCFIFASKGCVGFLLFDLALESVSLEKELLGVQL
jgi:hypothetical protein